MTKANSVPFNKLLKIVAVVDDQNTQIQTLLQCIAREGYEIEITASYERDVC
jgi:ornithine decarboxylase